MRLYSTSTPNYKLLYERFFLPSVPDWVEHTHYNLNPNFPLNSWDYFLEAIREKVRLIVSSIDRAAPNDLICWSDIDIEIYDLQEEHLRRLMSDLNAEIAFQMQKSGRPNVNTGFFVAFPTKQVRDLFTTALKVIEDHGKLQEEPAINDLLLNGFQIQWAHLPKSFYARTQGWPPP